MQRLNTDGTKLWPNQGLLISGNPQNTYLVDYSLTCDAKNNAIVVFTDLRSGEPDVYAYKISPAGHFLWGANGVALSSGKEGEYNPTVAATSDGCYVFAWIASRNPDQVAMQRLSSDGKKSWGNVPVLYGSSNGDGYTNPKLVPSDKGNVILVHTVTTGTFPSQSVKIAAQKFDKSGAIKWKKGGVWIQDIGNAMIFTAPFVGSDGVNGAVVAWHDDRNKTNVQGAFVQRINSSGTLSLPANGAKVTVISDFNEFNPVAGYIPKTNEIVVFWKATDKGQGQIALYGQKFNAKGKRQWSDVGLSIEPFSSASISQIEVATTSNSAFVAYNLGNSSGLNSSVKGTLITLSNTKNIPTTVVISSVQSQKDKLSIVADKSNSAIFVWSDFRSGNEGIYAQKLNASGVLGLGSKK
jgi:hypothetical protein